MSSTVHKLLFSPPPSPPLEGDMVPESSPFAPLRSLLPAALDTPPRSPKISRAGTPTLLLPSSTSPVPKVLAKSLALLNPIDVELANNSRSQHLMSLNEPSRREKPSLRFSPPLLSPRLIMVRNRLPRPVLRLASFIVLVLSGVLLVRALTAPIPTPSVDQFTHRAAYMPAVIAVNRQMPLVAPPPRTFRPASHPLPASHELLALQTFVLETAYNHLSGTVDASKALDAHDLLGRAALRLGGSGSDREQQWLTEVEAANADKVVVWTATAGVPHYVLEGINSRHGHGMRASLVPTLGRSDGHLIRAVFSRLGLDIDSNPILVIGGEAVVATTEKMKALRESGELAQKLARIGWR